MGLPQYLAGRISKAADDPRHAAGFRAKKGMVGPSSLILKVASLLYA